MIFILGFRNKTYPSEAIYNRYFGFYLYLNFDVASLQFGSCFGYFKFLKTFQMDIFEGRRSWPLQCHDPATRLMLVYFFLEFSEA